jgi:hypothetical protein
MATTPMIGPDGSIADVPHESVQQAVRAGARIAFDMLSPDGKERAAVPLEGMHAAIAAGAQLAPSSAGDYAAASVPKPTDPLQHVTGYDALGSVGDSFSNRVGNRIGQNLESIPAAAQQLGQETQQAATSPHSVHALVSNTANAVTGTLQRLWNDYHDPANLAGDVVTGYVGGEALGGGAAAEAKVTPATQPVTATSSTASDVMTTSPAVKPYKAKAAAAGAGGDDLTDILKASLDLARKKKSIK